MVLDGHLMDNTHMDDQLEAGPVSEVTGVALERPTGITMAEVFLPDPATEMRL